MLAKVRICVCPIPGCPTIGKSPTAGCPHHPARALVKEVYVHKRDTKSQPVDSDLFAKLCKDSGA